MLLKKDLENNTKKLKQQEAAAEEELQKMRDYVKLMELDFKAKKENNEGLLERLKEFTCMTLKLSNISSNGDTIGWETNLTKALTASTYEHINFLRAVQG